MVRLTPQRQQPQPGQHTEDAAMATIHKTYHSQEDILYVLSHTRLTLIQVEVPGRSDVYHLKIKKPAAVELIKDNPPGEFQMHVSYWDDGMKIATISKENG